MTVSYNLDIASSSTFSFLRLIFRWRGSIWKEKELRSVLVELGTWTLLYYAVFSIYHFLLDVPHQVQFSQFAKFIDSKLVVTVPLTFILGFFVTIVVDRWKNMFANIGFVDSAALFINAYVRGEDGELRTIRRNMVRWLCLCQVLVLRDISAKVRKRFPSMDAMEEAGFLQSGEERKLLEAVNNGYAKYWVPINWCFTSCCRLRQRGVISSDPLLNVLLVEIRTYREKLQTLCNYDWVPVPLAYPQVVFLAVRIYFMLCIISRQSRIEQGIDNVVVIIPFMTMVQFVIYMGWLRVAEALLNPLGEDDDDFECNYIIDRNLAIALTMVDSCHGEMPEYSMDKFRDRPPLYTTESTPRSQNCLLGSAAKVEERVMRRKGSEKISLHDETGVERKLIMNEPLTNSDTFQMA